MIPTRTLDSGQAMPAIGLGTWPLLNAQAAEVVAQALGAGYRLVDTAARYGNEAGVGRGIVRSGLDRAAVFVVSKLRGGDQGERQTARAVDASLANLGLDYLDLYLIHWPLPALGLYAETWRALEAQRAAGAIRAIGVSNFLPEHLERLDAPAPAVNQIEVHPYFPQVEAVEYHAARGIATMAWAPLGRGKAVLAEPVITDIAARAGRTPAQVVLRWHIQRGTVPIPKSVSPARLRENLDVFDFELTDREVAQITALGRGARIVESSAVHDER
ncbi:MAG: aldo/keto reductase [Bifidobacteriaceae bacterium]|jgi:diketogulonate reductase-like aldo/keto reductase|nr:aldo/keto reductase [Bifidobacteriaceae bacterium]